MVNIYLVGFMGAGKTTVGKALSHKLGKLFIDIDKEIEGKAGADTGEIFSQVGEQGFRRLETQVLASYSEESDLVVACGGGTVLSSANRWMLKSTGITVLLTGEAEVLYSRVKNQRHRPLLKEDMSLENVEKMLIQREDFYLESGEFVVDTSEKTVDAIVEEIAQYVVDHSEFKKEEINIYKELLEISDPVKLGNFLFSSTHENSENAEIRFQQRRWKSRYYFTNRKKSQVGDKYVGFYLEISSYKDTVAGKKELAKVLKATLGSYETRDFAEDFIQVFLEDLAIAGRFYLSTMEEPVLVFGLFHVNDKDLASRHEKTIAKLLEYHFYNIMLLEHWDPMIFWGGVGLFSAIEQDPELGKAFSRQVKKIEDKDFRNWLEERFKKDYKEFNKNNKKK